MYEIPYKEGEFKTPYTCRKCHVRSLVTVRYEQDTPQSLVHRVVKGDCGNCERELGR